jgi:hypothetical protein
MNYKKLQKDYPLAYEVYKNRKIRNPIDFFDSIKIRIFVGYSSNGCFSVEVYRAKTENESSGEGDWRMIRIGHINSYYARSTAQEKGIRIALEVLNEWLEKDVIPKHVRPKIT